jgi:disulfide bond formation protein DsbB
VICWKTQLTRPVKTALAGLLAFLILLSAMLSVSPELHHRLHQGSADRAHQCAVTIFSQHQVLLDAAPTALFVFAACFFYWLPLAQTPVLAKIDSRLSPSRASPASL